MPPVELEVVEGDITRLDVDAIANAANDRLWMGAGVAGAIKRAGGGGVEREAVAEGAIPGGGGRASGAGFRRRRRGGVGVAAAPGGRWGGRRGGGDGRPPPRPAHDRAPRLALRPHGPLGKPGWGRDRLVRAQCGERLLGRAAEVAVD